MDYDGTISSAMLGHSETRGFPKVSFSMASLLYQKLTCVWGEIDMFT